MNKIKIDGKIGFKKTYSMEGGKSNVLVLGLNNIEKTKNGKDWRTSIIVKAFGVSKKECEAFELEQQVEVTGKLTSETYNEKTTYYILTESDSIITLF